jgi:hypothetical protein
MLAAQVRDFLPRLSGLEHGDDLLLRESALPHPILPATGGGLALYADQFSGGRSGARADGLSDFFIAFS